MNKEEMLRLRLKGKTHAEIAMLSTEQGRTVSRQRVQRILRDIPVTRVYVLDTPETHQDEDRGGLKGVLDKRE